MIATPQTKTYTPEEYLNLETQSETKNEYRNGEIIPMAGGTINHNKIALNFCRKFPLTIDGQDYEVYHADVRLWVPRYNIYTYPDVMVLAGEPIYQENRTDTVINPKLVVEVLSDSTRNYDRAQKFLYYRSIASFQEYILIDQYSFHVEQFSKTENGKWLLTEYEDADDQLTLESVNYTLPLKDIYERVSFHNPPDHEPTSGTLL